MTLNEGVATMGRGGGWPAIAGASEREVLYYALLPNALISLHPDYAMLHTLWPRGAGRTEVVCEWFFEPATMALEGFDPAEAVEFWDTVNRQDWHVCELTQKGVGSRGFSAAATRPTSTRSTSSTGWSARPYLRALGPRGGARARGHDEPDRHQVARAERLA